MKKMKLFCGILIGLMIFSSCSSNDDAPTAENELIGIWLRIDSNDTFEERYTFNPNQTGNNYFLEGSFTNSSDFNWTTENNILNTTTDDDSFDITVPYQINSDGQLVLANDAELTYNKIE